MAEKKKVTTMVLTVDLQCHKCYKKVKKVLCKFPQIQDQAYDEKQNHVVVKVVCCSPEKMRDRICAKGGCAIKSIEIKEDKKPTPPPSPTPKPPPTNQSYTLNVIACCTNCYYRHHDGLCQKPLVCCMDCNKGHHGGPCQKPLVCCMDCNKGHHGGPCQKPPVPPKTVNTCCMDCKHHDGPCQKPAAPPKTVTACCIDCFHGHPGGPCQSGFYERSGYDSGCGRSYSCNYGVALSDCFSEENPQGCTVM